MSQQKMNVFNHSYPKEMDRHQRPKVGVRFNPYKWPEGHGMADDIGKRL